MLWNWLRRRDPAELGQRARREHSQWLTRAMTEGRSYPRIPARRADLGGFSELLSRPEGRIVVDWWWAHTLEQVDSDSER